MVVSPVGRRRVMPSNSEPTAGVGDGVAPLGAVLAGDDGAGVGGGDRAEAGDLAGLLVVAEQGGQCHPHLDADALVVALYWWGRDAPAAPGVGGLVVARVPLGGRLSSPGSGGGGSSLPDGGRADG